MKPDNTLDIEMISQGLDAEQAKKVWQPFLDWGGAFAERRIRLKGGWLSEAYRRDTGGTCNGGKSIGRKSVFLGMAIPCTRCLTMSSYT